MDSTAPIFIVGPARSGTTLLCALVNQHRDIALLHEASLLSMFPNPDRPVRDDWVERVGIWSKVYHRHQMDPGAIDRSSVRTPREAALSLYQAYARQKGKSRFGEKSPGYIRMLPDLFCLFPDARVILVWRDIEEICRSNLRRAKVNPHTYHKGKILEVLTTYDRVQTQLENASIPADSVFHISYDRILNDTESVMQDMCSFLGIPFDPQMTEIGSADQSFVVGKGKPLGDRLAKKKYNDEGLITPSLQGKLDRYRQRWAERFPHGYTQQVTTTRPEGGPSPSAWELAWDRIRIRLVGLTFHLKRAILARVPSTWWTAYRRWHGRK